MFSFSPKHSFLVGVDSDGCAFDTMELKHKECFIPHLINTYELQGVSKYAREAAEFVNLYSTSRGINRFPALVETLEWLQKRPEVRARGLDIQIPAGLTKWIKEETKLGNPALKAAVKANPDPDLVQALAWSEAVNKQVNDFVRHVPPFPFVKESLQRLGEQADVLVVSATPNEALEREWAEHGIDKFVAAICGQEVGTKKEVLGVAKQYAADHVLMIGDAPGDQKAAEANKALFYPILPGSEEASWDRFFKEGIDRFFKGTYAGAYQQELNAEFAKRLPSKPSWKLID